MKERITDPRFIAGVAMSAAEHLGGLSKCAQNPVGFAQLARFLGVELQKMATGQYDPMDVIKKKAEIKVQTGKLRSAPGPAAALTKSAQEEGYVVPEYSGFSGGEGESYYELTPEMLAQILASYYQ